MTSIDESKLLSVEDGEILTSSSQPESTPRSHWIRFLLAWTACVLSGGFLPGQALFTQQFASQGVFAQMCETNTTTCTEQYIVLANLFNILSALVFVAFLPAGILLDSLGGRFTGVFGSFLLLLGILIIYVSILLPSNGENASTITQTGQLILFPLGIIIADFGSVVNSLSLFSFLFHLPGWNGLIVSLTNCCYYVAAYLPVAFQIFIDNSGGKIQFPTALLLYGVVGVGIVSIPLYWMCVPSQKEYYEVAQRVLGMPLPKSRYSDTIDWSKLLKSQLKTVKMSWKCLTCRKDYLRGHILVLSASLMGFAAVFVYASIPAPYAKILFSQEGSTGNPASKMGKLVATNLTLLGFTLAPVVGVIIDKFRGGLAMVAFMNTLSMLMIIIFSPIQNSWSAQIVAVSGVNFFQVTNQTLLMKYILAFSPPTRIGTVNGLFVSSFTLYAIPVMLLYTSFLYGITSGSNEVTYSVSQKVWQYYGPTLLFALIASVLFLLIGSRLYPRKQSSSGSGRRSEGYDLMMTDNTSEGNETSGVRGCLTSSLLPPEPPLLPEDELELSRRFFVGNLDDACTVLDMSRADLLKLSSSENVMDMRKLSQRMAASGDRLVLLARQKIEQMMEDQQHRSRPPAGTMDIGDRWIVTDRTYHREFLVGFFLDSFWPLKHSPYKGNHMLENWSMKDVDRLSMFARGKGSKVTFHHDSSELEKALIQNFAFQWSILYFTCMEFGHILELKKRKAFSKDLAAVLFAIPPGITMEISSLEYFYGIAHTGSDKGLSMPEVPPTQTAKDMALTQIFEANKPSSKPKGYWYVPGLASDGKYRGQGCALKLLQVVKDWARRDETFVYLETDDVTATNFYEKKAGFKRVWSEKIKIDEEDCGTEAVGLKYDPLW